jgi:hypothetical protein
MRRRGSRGAARPPNKLASTPRGVCCVRRSHLPLADREGESHWRAMNDLQDTQRGLPDQIARFGRSSPSPLERHRPDCIVSL